MFVKELYRIILMSPDHSLGLDTITIAPVAEDFWELARVDVQEPEVKLYIIPTAYWCKNRGFNISVVQVGPGLGINAHYLSAILDAKMVDVQIQMFVPAKQDLLEIYAKQMSMNVIQSLAIRYVPTFLEHIPVRANLVM